jgi:hypothetical protein
MRLAIVHLSIVRQSHIVRNQTGCEMRPATIDNPFQAVSYCAILAREVQCVGGYHSYMLTRTELTEEQRRRVR